MPSLAGSRSPFPGRPGGATCRRILVVLLVFEIVTPEVERISWSSGTANGSSSSSANAVEAEGLAGFAVGSEVRAREEKPLRVARELRVSSPVDGDVASAAPFAYC